MSWWRRLVDRATGRALPEGFTGELAAEEYVIGVAGLRGGGHLVATSHGLWLPHGEGYRRLGWHLISKATWSGGALEVTEAEETGTAGSAVLLRDLPVARFVLAEPGRVPEVVQRRVTESIRSRHHQELPGGGAWFVQRRVPGRDGIVLQVRVDEGTDVELVRRIASEVGDTINRAAREQRRHQ
ncbi:hypothetical protein [Gandjariella thermophila]|uniref:hypothetical protein n=1 Tax=Gandjariella thermophila TaxID=1931992 RepID=UPI0035313AAE